MERPRRAASKITDFRRYHLSGDLDISLQGKVGEVVNQFEDIMSHAHEELCQQLAEEEERSRQMQEEVELTRIKNQLEAKKLKQKTWQSAMEQLQLTKEQIEKDHQESREKIKAMAKEVGDKSAKEVTDWFSQQMAALGSTGGAPLSEAELKAKKEQEEKERAIAQLKKQQEDISQQLRVLTAENPVPEEPSDTDPLALLKKAQGHPSKQPQDLLFQQLKVLLIQQKGGGPQQGTAEGPHHRAKPKWLAQEGQQP